MLSGSCSELGVFISIDFSESHTIQCIMNLLSIKGCLPTKKKETNDKKARGILQE